MLSARQNKKRNDQYRTGPVYISSVKRLVRFDPALERLPAVTVITDADES
jgi:hypothetical protein